MFKYLGGNNYRQALKTGNSYLKNGKNPIINYAIESSSNPSRVYKEYSNLIKKIPNTKYGVALKLSSVNFDKTIANDIVNLCKEKSIRLYIDAENDENNDRYNDMVDEMVFNYNNNNIVYKTYQMYRKDSLDRLVRDMELCKKSNKYFCCKLVRGAYWDSEYNNGHLFVNKYETDNSFNTGVLKLYNTDYNKIDVLLATHNKLSIDLGLLLNKEKRVFEFAHLQGMREGYYNNITDDKVNVYIPYGPYIEMIPYLVRRLYENMDMLKYL